MRYLEDFEPGQVYGGSARALVEMERIKSFAAEFDPQPFHLDENAAAASLFKGLAASGWHTAALTMRLLVASEVRLLKSTTTLNQRGEAVQVSIGNLFVPRR
jgi:acyl dehydratase